MDSSLRGRKLWDDNNFASMKMDEYCKDLEARGGDVDEPMIPTRVVRNGLVKVKRGCCRGRNRVNPGGQDCRGRNDRML